MSFLPIAIACLLVLPLLILLRRFHLHRPSSTLPGPPRIPIVGNLLPSTGVWEQLAEYGKQYGPVYSIRVFLRQMVIVTTVSATRELLESRSSIYSGRNAPKMAELCGMDEGILFQPDPTRLRQGRRFLATGLQASPLKEYQHVMQRHQVAFLMRLLQKPKDFYSLIPLLPTGVALEMAYGHQVTSEDDPLATKIRTAIGNFSRATAFSPTDGFSVNWLPFLAFIPGMSFRRIAAEWKEFGYRTSVDAFNMVKEQLANGTARPSLVAKALEEKEGSYDTDVLMRAAVQLSSGATDTTASALRSFFLAMTLYPEVQAKAQTEIDHHLKTKGAGRLPNYTQDRDDLPYTFALLREVMRWHGPSPVFGRTPTEDDVYDGHLIKKGSLIVINLWAMLHDESIFPDYRAFRPERWLDGTLLDKHDIDPLVLNFGFGRRACPGRLMAIDILFSTISSTLAAFNISRAKDAQGNEVIPKEEYNRLAIISPLPFECNIKPRSDVAKQLVQDAANALG